MSAFLPNTSTTTNLQAHNLAWYPVIETAPFRQAYRVLPEVPDDQALRALQSAILSTNRALAGWKAEQAAAGHATLADVPADAYGEQTELELHYKAAVHATAKALLMDARRQTDTTADGHDRADALEHSADDYRAESTRALRAMLGQTGTTVELI